jgi:hypothetical protein
MKINKKCEKMREIIGIDLNRHQKVRITRGDKNGWDGWLVIYHHKKIIDEGLVPWLRYDVLNHILECPNCKKEYRGNIKDIRISLRRIKWELKQQQ